MRKNVALAGVILLFLAIIFIFISSPLLSNYSGAGMHYSNNYFISNPIKLNSSDILNVETSSIIYLIPQSSIDKITHTDISSLQTPPSARTSFGGITTETWSSLDGTYFLVSFNSSSVNTKLSIITSSLQPKTFEYALVAFIGIVSLFAGAFMIFAGLILKQKKQPLQDKIITNENPTKQNDENKK
ncbi:MAG: hypothetical protein QW292_13740 [Candidatus Parvarchaeota archaeon]